MYVALASFWCLMMAVDRSWLLLSLGSTFSQMDMLCGFSACRQVMLLLLVFGTMSVPASGSFELSTILGVGRRPARKHDTTQLIVTQTPALLALADVTSTTSYESIAVAGIW